LAAFACALAAPLAALDYWFAEYAPTTAAAAIPQGMSALLHDFAADVDHLKRHIAAFFKCQFAMFLGARARVHLHGRQGGEVHVEWYSFVVVQH
jgi:hypothetical protein